MSDTALPTSAPRIWNVPNQVTVSRLVLAVILFALLSLGYYAAALVCFIVAASTDWVDGYWARKYGQITQLGRILDPFADKMIICGTFIYLAASPQLVDGSPASGVAAWVMSPPRSRTPLYSTAAAGVSGSAGSGAGVAT